MLRFLHYCLVTEHIINKWHPPGSIRMAFDIRANETALEENPVERLIWAYGMTRPGSKLPNTQVLGHFAAGFLKIDFSKEALPILPAEGHQTSDGGSKVDSAKPATTNAGDSATLEMTTGDAVPYGKHEKLIVAHGTMLSFGFLVFLPAGTLVARWTRTFTSRWFRAHSIINMSIALPIISIGWLLGPIAVACHQGEHMASTHQVKSFYNVKIAPARLTQLSEIDLWIVFTLTIFPANMVGTLYPPQKGGRIGTKRRPPPSFKYFPYLLWSSGHGTGFLPGMSVSHSNARYLKYILSLKARSGLDLWEWATGRGPLHRWCHDLWLAWTVVSLLSTDFAPFLRPLFYSCCPPVTSLAFLFYPVNSTRNACPPCQAAISTPRLTVWTRLFSLRPAFTKRVTVDSVPREAEWTQQFSKLSKLRIS